MKKSLKRTLIVGASFVAAMNYNCGAYGPAPVDNPKLYHEYISESASTTQNTTKAEEKTNDNVSEDTDNETTDTDTEETEEASEDKTGD